MNGYKTDLCGIKLILGSSGSGNNQLNYPTGLALDSATGTLYIADAGNNRIM